MSGSNHWQRAGQLVMAQIVLVGLGAGAAAALLFASVTSGALVSIFLFYLAPLPILIAALGWSHWSGLHRRRHRGGVPRARVRHDCFSWRS